MLIYQQRNDAAVPIAVSAPAPMPVVKLVWVIAFVFTLGIGLVAQEPLGMIGGLL